MTSGKLKLRLLKGLLVLTAVTACRAGSIELGGGGIITASGSGLTNAAETITFDGLSILPELAVSNLYQSDGVTFFGLYYSTERAAGVIPGDSTYVSNFSDIEIAPQTATIEFAAPISQFSFELRSQPGVTSVAVNKYLDSSHWAIEYVYLNSDLGGNDFYTYKNTDPLAITSLTISTSSSDNAFVLDNLAFGVASPPPPIAAPLPSGSFAGLALLALCVAQQVFTRKTQGRGDR